MSSASKPQVLLANAQEKTWDFLSLLMKDLSGYELVRVKDLNEVIEGTIPNLKPILTIVDGQSEVAQAAECVQMIKMTYPVPLLVLHGPSAPIDFALFKKNGADQLLHFHYDREFIGDLILEMAPVDFGKELPLAALNSLDYNEIHPEIETNFDIYIHLPSNQKSILYRKKGSLVEEKSVEKFRDSKQNLYFKKTETKKFLEYARTSLTMRNTNQVVSLTEKLIKAKRTIFEIMSEFFNSGMNNLESGKAIFERCRHIVDDFNLLKPKTISEAVSQIALLSGNHRSFYNDSISVCNFAALIGHILELPLPEIESLALAGLLHNIGLADVPAYTTGIDIQSLSAADLSSYKHYPTRSVQMVKNQRVPLPEIVSSAIEQHQENMDGSGFPMQVGSDKISKHARILRIALRIQELTALTEGHQNSTFNAAIKALKEEVTGSSPCYDIQMVMNLVKKASI